ncbi:hypothetical protein I316_07226 [Kwoniella heveanensis BCC8398]|uniref:C2H2-type domain-containing protein n=1 Tax=Kwoniella heveanensis BCC8398 TaxID=1296120 RepID=A0A1B9GJH4_9TREE|nr:hypothetical protein I316_07226 [Kwoniella heveanensis BCC8398]
MALTSSTTAVPSERCDPYPHRPTSRRFTHQPGHQLTTRPLATFPQASGAPSSSTLAIGIPTGVVARRSNAHEATRNTGRYQPSRGAQRDAKYSRKLAAAAAGAQTPVPAASARSKNSSSSEHAHTRGSSGTTMQKDHQYERRAIVHPKKQEYPTSARSQLHVVSRDPPSNERLMERIRKEQIAAVQAARKEHQETLALRAKKEEEERRKVRRIQLQVFVHARPTHCEWDDCQAVLNSWALLEKHLHHAHLHPRHQPSFSASNPDLKPDPAPGLVRCRWQGCSEAFENREACYRHALTGHMGSFAARCPFNCLFQGPSFPSLMAHISRRHPDATPDDFVPGLIHFPPSIPPLSSLFQLPQPSAYEVVHWLKPIRPYSEGIGHRSRKMIMRNCMKGRYPRVDAYEDKRGAGAAIKAIIENAKRLNHVPPYSAVSVKIEGDQELDRIGGDGDVEDEEPGTARTIVELVDVQKSAKSATEAAKLEHSDLYHRETESASTLYASDSGDTLTTESTGRGPKKRRKRNSISISERSASTSVSSSSGIAAEEHKGQARHVGDAGNLSPREERMKRRRLRSRIGDGKTSQGETP